MSVENYTASGIGKIINSNLIDDKDIQVLSNNANTLAHVYLNKQIYRTETEMRYSVLNEVKFPYPASKYWQACRECDGFFKHLIQDSITLKNYRQKSSLNKLN